MRNIAQEHGPKAHHPGKNPDRDRFARPVQATYGPGRISVGTETLESQWVAIDDTALQVSEASGDVHHVL